MTSGEDTGPVGAGHVPVMVGEAVEWLRPRPGVFLVDATVGLGGHAAALLAAAPGARLLGVDRDPSALAVARERLAAAGDAVVLRQAHYADLPALLAELGEEGADAVLLDLGVSSLQLDDPGRGFSFQAEGPLDMRMGPGAAPSAHEVVNAWSEAELARVIAEYGEEPRARAVARAIVRARPLATTTELAGVIAAVLGRPRPGLHPATRTFQAIRIAVNDELAGLERFLAEGWRLLRPGGRLAVLAYHSLEDRPVKTAFRRWAASCLCPPRAPACTCGWSAKVRILTRRPLRPSDAEVRRNPRARSARLRVVERLGGGA
ncbi:MAG TPA: 16S rRNA (cytosine(1402)-N(4))-methyltransferase RsmH [Gaiellaceae bacterium]|nr:16S rRNA (cytosine(1402)-N(4))-methyltransferase RsmH [Gaiellaceae bacterium]